MSTDLDTGISNLLLNCAELQSGETLLIVHEDSDLGWYDDKVAQAVCVRAEQMGLKTTMQQVGAPTLNKERWLIDKIAEHDCTIFFARVGDQDRFEDNAGQERSVMVYARDVDSLGSAFGCAHHRAMSAFKNAINQVSLGSQNITITCPLGTLLSGRPPAMALEDDADVTVKRFPLGVPQPIPASGFSGKVALTGYLTPTGSKPYDPPNCKIDGIVFAHVEAGRITRFDGPQASVSAVEDHYQRVSQQLGIDRDCVHSFHAGIHPGSAYPHCVDDDPDRWSNNVFTHPRYLHFHTCGDYAPAEICWMVLDPTINIDGRNLWENGRITPSNFEATRKVVEEWPDLEQMLRNQNGPIGLKRSVA
ncbi:MAG: hypothetical protein ABJM29_16800 [Rhizobiaceae bacterium]